MKKIRVFIIGFIVSILFQLQSVQAVVKNDESNINFNRITNEDGLSQTTINYIYQDSRGYMWIATNDGLNRYDGKDIEVIRVKAEGDNSISANYISCIIEDSNEYLWVGTVNGLNRLDRESGEIKQYYAGEEEGSLSHYGICEIFIDSKDRMWVSTLDGLNLYNSETDEFERVLYSEEEEILTDQVIYSVVEDHEGNLWVGTESGLNKYNEKTNTVEKYIADGKENSISVNEVYDLFIEDDILWIATTEGGLNRFNLTTGKIDVFKNEPDDDGSIPSNIVTNVLKDKQGNIWVATDNGLAKFDSRTQKFKTYKNKIYDNTTISNDSILYIFEDKGGVIWVGTLDGLSYFYPKSIFKTYRHDPFDENSIVDNMVDGIYEDRDGLLWVGSAAKGLNLIDREKSKIERISNEKLGKDIFTSDKITVITGQDEYIWIGTGFGLNKINKETGEIKHYFEDYENTRESTIRNLYIDSIGTLWVSTRGGLYTIDKDDNIYSYDEMFLEKGISEELISVVTEDSQGYIWIGFGTDNGLVRLDRDTKEIVQYTVDKNNPNSISCNSIKDIAEDRNGDLWIATNIGLNKFSRDTEVFTKYYEADGLSNDYVYSVLLDSYNNPWVSTNNGISRLDVKDEEITSFNVNDGLQGNEFNYSSSFKSESGEMFFGGINGFNSFNPRDYEEKKYTTPVEIGQVSINGAKSKNIDKVVMESNKSNISFKYFIPDYRSSKSLEYRYRVKGIDDEWNIIKNSNSITYNNIMPGEYVFEIQGRNSYGNWSESSTVEFEKEVPLWRRGWVICIYILVIIAIVIIIINKVRILEGLIRQRTKELDFKLKRNEEIYTKVINNERTKNNYFVNLSHELRTPLNVISASIQLIGALNEKEENISKSKLEHYMKVLDGNTKKLLKLINDIIDTSKIEAGAYKLRIKENDIVNLVEEIALSMKDYIESKGIELIIDPEMEERIIQCDANEIEKCVTNILGNAAKFTPEGGSIEVRIRELGDNIYIDFKDTGVGINEKDIEFIFERFGQSYNKKTEEVTGSGLGLALTKQLVLLHKGKIAVESKLGKGSTFTIKLPIIQNKK